MKMDNSGTQVTMSIEIYEVYKAAWDAANKNYDLRIDRDFGYSAYVFKSESEVIEGLKTEIIRLQERIQELKAAKKTKWF